MPPTSFTDSEVADRVVAINDHAPIGSPRAASITPIDHERWLPDSASDADIGDQF
jgi:hypothetical protein